MATTTLDRPAPPPADRSTAPADPAAGSSVADAPGEPPEIVDAVTTAAVTTVADVHQALVEVTVAVGTVAAAAVLHHLARTAAALGDLAASLDVDRRRPAPA
jgi:hypothetical protein